MKQWTVQSLGYSIDWVQNKLHAVSRYVARLHCGVAYTPMSRNKDILTALRTEQLRRCRLNMQSHFQFLRAIETVTSHRGNIRRASDLAKYTGKGKGITKTVLNYIEDVLHGNKPINSPPPTEAQIRKAQTRRLPKSYLPGARTGAEAILLTLYQHSLQGDEILTKDQILPDAQSMCDSDMYQPDASGYNAWKGVDTLTEKKLVVRHRHSRAVRSFGRHGMRKDEFQITEAGKQVAKECLARRGSDSNSITGVGVSPKSERVVSHASRPNCRCQRPAQLLWSTKNGKRLRVWRCANATRYTPMGRCFFDQPCWLSRRTATNVPISSQKCKMCSPGTCPDCPLLNTFLSSTGSQIEFKIGKKRRIHLHQVCEGLGLTHVSEDTGGNRRKLVITKPCSSLVPPSSPLVPPSPALVPPSSARPTTLSSPRATTLSSPRAALDSARSFRVGADNFSTHDTIPAASTSSLAPFSPSRPPPSSCSYARSPSELGKEALRAARLIALALRDSQTPKAISSPTNRSPSSQKRKRTPRSPPTRKKCRSTASLDAIDLVSSAEDNSPENFPNPPHISASNAVHNSSAFGAQNASASRSLTGGVRKMVMCIVDDMGERLRNRDPNRIYERCSREHARVKEMGVCVGRLRLALGDYAVGEWVGVSGSEWVRN